jgi:hypothetical protein
MDINTTHLSELLLYLPEFLLLPLGYCMTDQLEPTITRPTATDMFKAQEVKGFRLALPSLPSV